MGQMDHGRLPVFVGGLLIFPRDANAGGIEVGQPPEQLMVQGDAECDRTEESADAIDGQII